MNHHYSRLHEQRQLQQAIKRLRPYHIKAAALMQTNAFDFLFKSSMLVTAFLLGAYVSA